MNNLLIGANGDQERFWRLSKRSLLFKRNTNLYFNTFYLKNAIVCQYLAISQQGCPHPCPFSYWRRMACHIKTGGCHLQHQNLRTTVSWCRAHADHVAFASATKALTYLTKALTSKNGWSARNLEIKIGVLANSTIWQGFISWIQIFLSRTLKIVMYNARCYSHVIMGVKVWFSAEWRLNALLTFKWFSAL